MSSVIHPHAGIDYHRPGGRASAGLAAAAILLAGGALVAVYRQEAWEYPIMLAVNAYARHSVALDRLMHALTARDLLQGVPFVGLIWFLWFESEAPSRRITLLIGMVAASSAGIISRTMQLTLPTHWRPLHEPALGLVPPFGVDPESLNHFSSFPSDHGAVFFTLCAAICQIRPRLGVAAFVWAAVVDLARVYEGYHFPSDVVGSIGVGLVVLTVFQVARGWPLVARIVASAQSRPAWFYMFAFIVTVQIATLFDDLREIGRGVAKLLLHHDMFVG